MKRLLKLLIVLYLIENAGTVYSEIKERLQPIVRTDNITYEINRKADEIFKEIGFEEEMTVKS